MMIVRFWTWARTTRLPWSSGSKRHTGVTLDGRYSLILTNGNMVVSDHTMIASRGWYLRSHHWPAICILTICWCLICMRQYQLGPYEKYNPWFQHDSIHPILRSKSGAWTMKPETPAWRRRPVDYHGKSRGHQLEVSMAMGVSLKWLVCSGRHQKKWMITRGTTISGNLQLYIEILLDFQLGISHNGYVLWLFCWFVNSIH